MVTSIKLGIVICILVATIIWLATENEHSYQDGFNSGFSLGEYYYKRAAVCYWECFKTGVTGFWSPVHGWIGSMRCTINHDEVIETPCGIDPISIGYSDDEIRNGLFETECIYYQPEYFLDLNEYYKQ